MEHNSKRVNQQIRNFQRTIENFNFQEPFSRFLTRFYKENKQMGSSDRRMNSRFCYNYFRIGRSFSKLALVQRLTIAEFLCEDNSSVVQEFNPNWLNRTYNSIFDKFSFIEQHFAPFLEEVFPFSNELSEGISRRDFAISHFEQPDLFIRLRRGKEAVVKNELTKQNIDFKELSAQTLALSNGLNLQAFKKIQGFFEVQDFSSQNSLNEIPLDSTGDWWDACAASGGKSLLLLDRSPKLNLLVSDLRTSILRNLDDRFTVAGIKKPYRTKILDLSRSVEAVMHGEKFDGIIIDVPCSGSGTWGRTPEMLSMFKSDDIIKYQGLQKNIVKNAIPYLKPGKSLIYITCSVFKAENEEVVSFIENELKLKLVSKTPILGYKKQRADSMFTAHFVK